MNTALVLSNRHMLINLDDELQIKDLYFPHIGQNNQLNRYINKMFFWVNGQIYHVDSETCEISYDYLQNLNIAQAKILVKGPQLEVNLKDYILPDHDIYIRELILVNKSNYDLQVKVFFQNNFAINESEYADTVVWYQPAGCLMHYKKNCYLGIGSWQKFYQYTCAAKSDAGGLGAFPDMDGELRYNPVSTGNVNSCLSFKYDLKPGASANSQVYIAAAADINSLTQATTFLKASQPETLFTATCKYWQYIENRVSSSLSLNKLANIQDQQFAHKLKQNLLRSSMILLTQIDKNGAVLAANDGQYLKTGGNDTYSYFWPRDAANVIMALCDLGLQEEARQCLQFALTISGRTGYFLHKYFPELNQGQPMLGSSWHTWTDPAGNPQLPIQEDATALIILALAKYFRKFNDRDLLSQNWNTIEAMLKFLQSYNSKNFSIKAGIDQYFTGLNLNSNADAFPGDDLPYPSFDIWEQYWGIFSYTSITLLEAFKDGYFLAETVNAEYLKESLIIQYDSLKQAILSQLVVDGKFIKGFRINELTNSVFKDESADASLIYAATLSSDGEIKKILSASLPEITNVLSLATPSGGLARMTVDRYLRLNELYQGNPWFLNSLWQAETSISSGDMENAQEILNWTLLHTDNTGLMSEQINPYTGFSLGVKPLTWSHAEFIKAAVLYLKQLPA